MNETFNERYSCSDALNTKLFTRNYVFHFSLIHVFIYKYPGIQVSHHVVHFPLLK